MSTLLGLGLFCYLFNWFFFLSSTIANLLGKSSSAPMMPLVGPVLLTLWIVLTGHALWYIPLVWVLDIATVFALPTLGETLLFTPLTRKFILTGNHEDEHGEIHFYAFGKYSLKKKRQHAEQGCWLSCGDAGTYRQEAGKIYMEETSRGTQRVLVPIVEKQYKVEETTTDEHCRTINGWTFTGK